MIVSIFLITVFFIIAIAGATLITSALLGGEIIIKSWAALFLFAVGTFSWIIPLQIIDWMKLIPVQKRVRRILYPYFVTFIQVVLFSVYMVGLNVTIANVIFTNIGLIIFTSIIIVVANVMYVQFVRYIRRYKVGLRIPT